MEREASIHHKLFKFFMMPMLMMLISVGQVWGQETVSVAAGKLEFPSGASNGYYTIENTEFTNVATIKVAGKSSNVAQISNNKSFIITNASQAFCNH